MNDSIRSFTNDRSGLENRYGRMKRLRCSDGVSLPVIRNHKHAAKAYSLSISRRS